MNIHHGPFPNNTLLPVCQNEKSIIFGMTLHSAARLLHPNTMRATAQTDLRPSVSQQASIKIIAEQRHAAVSHAPDAPYQPKVSVRKTTNARNACVLLMATRKVYSPVAHSLNVRQQTKGTEK